MLSEPVNLLVFKLRTYSFIITSSFCIFVVFKSIKVLGGFREFIKILFEDSPIDDL